MSGLAKRISNVGPSVFAEMNALARARGAVNLSQGAPDFDGHPDVIAAAVAALQSGTTTQYAPSPGTPALRQAVADHARVQYGHELDPDREVLVLGGASLAVFFMTMALVDPGDEVIVFEPYFDTYVPNIEMAGGIPRFVPLRPPDWSFDPDELAAAFSDKTRLILINTPHNPTGKVFSRAELAQIAALCQQWDVIAVTDEVYEHLLYDDVQHVRLATLPGMADRTLTISSAGKTFSVTGFKIGWAMGPAPLLEGLKRIHEFSMYAVAHPLQAAVAQALRLPQSYYDGLKAFYQPRRDMLAGVLLEAGFDLVRPAQMGAFYLVADFSPLFDGDDFGFARYLIEEVGVACIPATPFFSPAHQDIGRKLVRFTYCKREDTLQAAAERLATLGR